MGWFTESKRRPERFGARSDLLPPPSRPAGANRLGNTEGDFQRPARQLTPSASEREFTLGFIWPSPASPLEAFPPLLTQLAPDPIAVRPAHCRLAFCNADCRPEGLQNSHGPSPTPAISISPSFPTPATRKAINVLVVSSVALAFISFWRAAAIVLCDLASTAYYIGGISEQAIGKAAPWFILGVMLFSYAVRAVYVESCTMFTRGGVYRVVKGAIGGGLAKLSVSALMFDYILTGPISAVSAGQYMVGLFIDMINLVLRHFGHPPIDHHRTEVKHLVNAVTVVLAIFITIYFWRLNIIGIHESSDKALRIMQLTTVMGVLIIGWSILTIFMHHLNRCTPRRSIPSSPIPASVETNPPKAGSKHFPSIVGASASSSPSATRCWP